MKGLRIRASVMECGGPPPLSYGYTFRGTNAVGARLSPPVIAAAP